MRFRIGRVAAIVAITALASLIIGPASAYDQPAGSAPSAPGRNSVGSPQIIDGQVYQKDINAGVVGVLRTPRQNSVTGWSVKDGSITMNDLSPATRAEIRTGQYTPKETFGKLGGTLTILPITITNIGGRFADRASRLGDFTIQPGTWLINASVVFDRKDEGSDGYAAPTTDTMPSFALRYGVELDDAGTVMGAPVSRRGFVELTGSSVKLVTVAGPTVVTAYGFGYNEDRSGFGGGQITVAAQITAVRVG
jgi:hypothetical protein